MVTAIGRIGRFWIVHSIEIASQGQIRLRLLNAANEILSFALNDKLPMKVISVDGSPCEPFEVGEVTTHQLSVLMLPLKIVKI